MLAALLTVELLQQVISLVYVHSARVFVICGFCHLWHKAFTMLLTFSHTASQCSLASHHIIIFMHSTAPTRCALHLVHIWCVSQPRGSTGSVCEVQWSLVRWTPTVLSVLMCQSVENGNLWWAVFTASQYYTDILVHRSARCIHDCHNDLLFVHALSIVFLCQQFDSIEIRFVFYRTLSSEKVSKRPPLQFSTRVLQPWQWVPTCWPDHQSSASESRLWRLTGQICTQRQCQAICQAKPFKVWWNFEVNFSVVTYNLA